MASDAPTLFTSLTISGLTLKNRVLMSPMTRDRATPELVPTDFGAETSMALYYTQRSSAGLIVTEATQVGDDGQGYPLTPGVYTTEQIAGWKTITDAVHEKGSLMFCQIWNCGRVSHTSYQPGGRAPPAPSVVTLTEGECFTMEGPKPWSTPREITVEEIKGYVEQFRQGALNCMKAGFDGVEIHAANGYLIDQFLKSNTNKRNDDYGGSLENKFRFLKEVIEACSEAIGSSKVAVHLTPGGSFNGAKDDAEEATSNHEYYIKQLDGMGLAYLHIKLSDDQDERHGGKIVPMELIRTWYNGTLVANNRFNEQEDYGESGLGKHYDAIAFGRAYVANPDLPARIAKKAELSTWDHTSFFGGSAKGYTDYPAMAE